MKIWIESWRRYLETEWTNSHYWFALGGYKHHKDHNYKGYSLDIVFLKWETSITWVNDYKAYQKVYDKRRSR